MKRPFALLQSRPETVATDDEYQAFLGLSGLAPERLVAIDIIPRPKLDLSDYQGIIMGGGPINFAVPASEKSLEQRELEAYIDDLMQQIIVRDIPFLGACLGIGAVVTALGGAMTYDAGEPVMAIDVAQTPEAAGDGLLANIPEVFRAFVGHKEGVRDVPAGAAVLARSSACLQMLRVGHNVYATQFHPELDPDGLALRLRLYKDMGYADPDEVEDLITAAYQEQTPYAPQILRNFINRYT